MTKPEREAAKRVRAAYSGMPLRFERVAAADADFIARGAGYSLSLGRGEARFLMAGAAHAPATALTMRLPGASQAVEARGRRMLPGLTNYVAGTNPREWRTGVRSYAEVEYRDIYPGVDVVYYGNQRQLEFDFVIAPGASHRTIALAFDGSTDLEIDRRGNLRVGTSAGTLVQQAPVIYQEHSGRRRRVRGGYELRPDGRVGFKIRSYDPRLPLVIDPVLTYSTYLGGSREERVGGVAFDAQGNMYVAGETGASDFPVSSPANSHGRENWDTFVVKLNPAGDQFLYATYIGGSGYEAPKGRGGHQRANGSAVDTRSRHAHLHGVGVGPRGQHVLDRHRVHRRRDHRYADRRREQFRLGRRDQRTVGTQPGVEAAGRESGAVARQCDGGAKQAHGVQESGRRAERDRGSRRPPRNC